MNVKFFIVAALAMLVMVSCDWLKGRKVSSEQTSGEVLHEAAEEDTSGAWADFKEERGLGDDVDLNALMRGFVSQIRPGEKLIPGETHSNDFEFIESYDGGDYRMFTVRKPGDDEHIRLLTGYEIYETGLSYSRGDAVRVEWSVDIMYEIGEGGLPYMAELATGVTKTADGPVSKFRTVHPEKMQYFHPNGWDPTEEEAESARERYTSPYFYGVVEYYLATSHRPEVQAPAADPSAVLCYSAWEQEKDGENYNVFGIWNENDTPEGDLPEAFVDIWLSDSHPRTIYERDPETGQLTKFSIY